MRRIDQPPADEPGGRRFGPGLNVVPPADLQEVAPPAEAGEAPQTLVHYVGVLTAPADEAELPVAEPPRPQPKRRRTLWVVALALIVVPPVLAVVGYAAVHPTAIERAMEHGRALLGPLLADRSAGAQTRTAGEDVAMEGKGR